MSESSKTINKNKEEKSKVRPQTYNLQHEITKFNLKIKGEKPKPREEKIPSSSKPTILYKDEKKTRINSVKFTNEKLNGLEITYQYNDLEGLFNYKKPQTSELKRREFSLPKKNNDYIYQKDYSRLKNSAFSEAHSKSLYNTIEGIKKVNRLKQAPTVYSYLGKQKNEFVEELKRKVAESENKSDEKDLTKKFLKKNNLTYILDKRAQNNIPYIYPIALIHENTFEKCSQMHRYEKVTQTFLNLRYRIEKEENKEIWIIKEFLMKNHFFDEKSYEADKINNFLRFLKSDLRIDYTKTMKEIIFDALNYVGDENDFPKNQGKNHVDQGTFHFNKTAKTFYKKSDLPSKSSSLDAFSPNALLERQKINFNNPKKVCESLEKEFAQIKTNNHKNDNIYIESDEKTVKRFYKKNPIDENDIEVFKKKKKLLEYIMWKRTKNEYLIEEEKKRLNI